MNTQPNGTAGTGENVSQQTAEDIGSQVSTKISPIARHMQKLDADRNNIIRQQARRITELEAEVKAKDVRITELGSAFEQSVKDYEDMRRQRDLRPIPSEILSALDPILDRHLQQLMPTSQSDTPPAN